jgi:hypothetical protein
MFRFSIRELMLVTLVVALAVGWGVDRSRLVKRQSNDSQWLDYVRSELKLTQQARDDEMQENTDLRVKLLNSSAPAPNPPKP